MGRGAGEGSRSLSRQLDLNHSEGPPGAALMQCGTKNGRLGSGRLFWCCGLVYFYLFDLLHMALRTCLPLLLQIAALFALCVHLGLLARSAFRILGVLRWSLPIAHGVVPSSRSGLLPELKPYADCKNINVRNSWNCHDKLTSG